MSLFASTEVKTAHLPADGGVFLPLRWGGSGEVNPDTRLTCQPTCLRSDPRREDTIHLKSIQESLTSLGLVFLLALLNKVSLNHKF